jgi:putative heme-binding domain-containing protein
MCRRNNAVRKSGKRVFGLLAAAMTMLSFTYFYYSSFGVVHAAGDPDVSSGEVLYRSHCAICHSFDGAGGRGPALTMPPFRRATTDEEFRKIIRGGISGTEMPAIWSINGEETNEIIRYVKSLSGQEPVELPGNVKRGRELYDANNCSNCHIIAGTGRGIGPELTDIGRRRNAAYLRRSLVDPSADTPEGFALISATSEDGTIVDGFRINEDSFTVQVRDIEGKFHSLRKWDLKRYRKNPGRSIMPKYPLLSQNDLDDMVAYMATLGRNDQ